jgi:hypothetical protein
VTFGRWTEPAALLPERSDRPRCSEWLLAELEPVLGAGAPAVVEAVRDVEAWISSRAEALREARTSRVDGVPAAGPARAASRLWEVLQPLQRLLRAVPTDDHQARPLAALCLGAALWAYETDLHRTAAVFAHLAQRVDRPLLPPDPRYAYELGRLALAVPELAERAAEWLTWSALEARRLGRWEVFGPALRALADHVAARGEPVAAARLRRLAQWADRRAPGSGREMPREQA